MIYISNGSHLVDAQNSLRKNRPLICWHSIIQVEDFLTPGDAGDENHPIQNVWSPDTFQFWRSEPITSGTPVLRHIEIVNANNFSVNYIMITRHNLASISASYKIQYYDSIEDDWFDITDYVAPQNNNVIINYFDIFAAPKFRIEFSIPSGSSTFFQIAHVKAGIILRLERPMFVGMTPYTLDQEVDGVVSESDNGNYLDQGIISEWNNWEIRQINNTPDFVRTNIIPFIRHMNTQREYDGTPQGAFGAAWRPDDYPDECLYCWKDPNQRVAPEISGRNGRMEWSCRGKAIV